MTKPFTPRRAVCLLLCALLLFFLAATVTRTARETETQTLLSVDGEGLWAQIPESAAVAIPATVTEEGLHYKETEDGLFLHYPLVGDTAIVTVTVAAPVETPTLVACVDGFWDDGRVINPSIVSEDGCTYTFHLLANNYCNQYAPRFGEEYTVVSVTHESEVTTGTVYRFNFIAAGALLLLLGVLFLCEKKLGFYAEVRGFLKGEADFAKALTGKRRVVHAVALGILIAFALWAFVDLALSLTLAFSSFILVALATLAVAAILVEGLYVREDLSFVRMFWLCAIVIAAALALSLPPTMLVAWDDEYHFAHMAQPAAFLLLDKLPLSAQALIVSRPFFTGFLGNTEVFAESLLSLDEVFISAGRLALPDLHPLLWVIAAPFLAIYAAFRYCAYLPGILVCLFGFGMGADIIFVIAVCRLVTTLIATTAIAFAVRRLLYGKFLFAICAFLPCALFLTVNFSCDPFITSLITLGLGYFIGELQRTDEPLTAKNATVMIAAIALSASPKPIYFVLLLPLLFLPMAKLGGKARARRFRLITIGVMIGVALTFVLPFLFDTSSYTDLRGGSTVSAVGQIWYIFTNPLAFLKTFLRFLESWLSLSSVAPYLASLAYWYNGSAMLGTLYLAMLFFFALADRPRDDRFDLSARPSYKVLSLLTTAVAVALVVLSLYVGFTPVGHPWVNGCQFRYLFPLFPFFFYFLGNVRLRCFLNEKKMTLLCLGGGAICNLALLAESLIKGFNL